MMRTSSSSSARTGRSREAAPGRALTRRLGLGGALFFAALLAATVVAVLVVRARTPDLVLEVLEPGRCYSFNPDAGSGARGAEIRFFVRRSDDAAAVEIVDSEEDVVRTLDSEVPLEAEASGHVRVARRGRRRRARRRRPLPARGDAAATATGSWSGRCG